MSANENLAPDRLRRSALAVGALALVAAAVLGARDPGALVPAYRFAIFACLAPALGSLIFILIYRLTGGQWAEALLPCLRTGTALLPWLWLLALPLLWLGRAGFRPPPHATGLLLAYFSHGALVARSIGYAVVFFLFAAGVRRVSGPAREQMRWFGPAGLIVLTFTLHVLSVDWFVALEPGWYSTGFGFVWMTAQAIAGLAAAVLVALLLGAAPATHGSAGRPRGIDWGNLLLTAVLSWTYVAFVQFLIIWSGNLPHEIEWYVRRGHGGWRVLVIVLALLQFATPFVLLLSRRLKQRALWLGATAALLLVAQVAYTAWLILPAFPSIALPGVAVAVLLALGGLGVFSAVYVTGARSRGRVEVVA